MSNINVRLMPRGECLFLYFRKPVFITSRRWMEEIGSEVYLWLTDKWIDFSLIEDLDIDTTMTTYDLGELRMI